MKIPKEARETALRMPPDARANWWFVGAFSDTGELIDVATLIVPEQRVSDAVIAAQAFAHRYAAQDFVIETHEGETLYEQRGGALFTNKLGVAGAS